MKLTVTKPRAALVVKVTKGLKVASAFDSYSEQDTADKLILPYLAKTHRFPTPDSLDYQAQHTLATDPARPGATMACIFQVAIPTSYLRRSATSTTSTTVIFTRPALTQPLPFSTSRCPSSSCQMAGNTNSIT